jgi:hypothetical protein
MKKKIGILFLLSLSLQIYAQSDSIQLNIVRAWSNHVDMTQSGGEWTITTTGTDPYFYILVPEGSYIDMETQKMLSFDYFCTNGTERLLVFVGNPGDQNYMVTVPYLSKAEGWTNKAIDLTNTLIPYYEPVTSLRVTIGQSPGVTIKIRNVMARPMTTKEQEEADNRENNLIEDQKLSELLRSYLNQTFKSTVSRIKSEQNGNLTIQGTVAEEDLENVKLIEIPMWKNITKLTEPESIIPLESKNFSLQVTRFAEDSHDRLLSAWAIATKQENSEEYTLLSAMHYVDEIEPRAKLTKAQPHSLKGIGGCPFDHQDMQDLNISSVTLNIILDHILFTEPGANRVQYKYAGKIWYADMNNVRSYDNQMLLASKNGWMVSAIILLPVVKNDQQGTWLKQAAHPDADFSAAFSLPNFTTKEGSEAYAATLNFLMDRYGREDERFGRVHYWIMHNEIQNGYFWASAGTKKIETYMDLYQKSMRTAYILMRLYDENAKPLISLDHDWTKEGDPRGYKGPELLDLLVNFSKKEGDFEWGIALHPYPQDINNPRTWEDSQATYSFDTKYLTYKNIEVIDDWARKPEVAFRGKFREVQLTEQGLNSPDYSDKWLNDQAAGMVYVWKKIERLQTITAFQYHLWADAYEEGGLKLGLRKYYNAPGDPYGKKPIWNVYQAIETPEWENVSNSYKSTLGITNWDEIYYSGLTSHRNIQIRTPDEVVVKTDYFTILGVYAGSDLNRLTEGLFVCKQTMDNGRIVSEKFYNRRYKFSLLN